MCRRTLYIPARPTHTATARPRETERAKTIGEAEADAARRRIEAEAQRRADLGAVVLDGAAAPVVGDVCLCRDAGLFGQMGEDGSGHLVLVAGEAAFVTEEGAFLRGQIRMEETVELDLEPAPETTPSEAAQAESIASTPLVIPPAVEPTQRIVRKKKEDYKKQMILLEQKVKTLSKSKSKTKNNTKQKILNSNSNNLSPKSKVLEIS